MAGAPLIVRIGDGFAARNRHQASSAKCCAWSARERNVSVAVPFQNGARGRGRRNLVRGVLYSSSVALTPPLPSVMSVHNMPRRDEFSWSIDRRESPAPRPARAMRDAGSPVRSCREIPAPILQPVCVADRPSCHLFTPTGRNARSRPGELRAQKRKAQPDRPQHGGQDGPVARLENRVAKPLQRTHSDLIFAPRRRQFTAGASLATRALNLHGVAQRSPG